MIISCFNFSKKRHELTALAARNHNSFIRRHGHGLSVIRSVEIVEYFNVRFQVWRA